MRSFLPSNDPIGNLDLDFERAWHFRPPVTETLVFRWRDLTSSRITRYLAVAVMAPTNQIVRVIDPGGSSYGYKYRVCLQPFH